VRVEPLAEPHREGLRAAVDAGPEILRYMAFPGDFDLWFDDAVASEADIPFAIVVQGEPVGSTRFLNVVPEHRRAEIGWTWLRRSVWGTGVNVETKLLLLEHAFERCGAQRVEFKTDARNLRTRGALLAMGASFEGIFRKHMVLPSGPRDSAWYAVVDDDWAAVKARLVHRLEDLRSRHPSLEG
jgi:RimJ/RimL family protein N-acetyltransferase